MKERALLVQGIRALNTDSSMRRVGWHKSQKTTTASAKPINQINALSAAK
jgi:hypothetical protein